jgi:hypothetical protein
MTPAQHRAGEAFMHRGYFGNPGMGATTTPPLTTVIGSGLLAAAPLTGPAAPFVALAGALTGLIGGLFKPDLTKEQATAIVNQIQSEYLQPNLNRWQSLPPNQKTQSAQVAALAVFDKAWAAVVQGCSNPALGTAGQRCISERQAGGSAPWCPTVTGCDWFILFRDPIANDPQVIPDPVPSVASVTGSVTGAVDSVGTSISTALGGISPLWIGVGIIAAALLLVSD